MSNDRLIIINANDETHFEYHEFNVSGDASDIFISPRHRISWIVFRGARTIGYRIEFDYVGTPFENATIDVPGGGISPQQKLIPNVPKHGYPYRVILENGWQDDPQGTPVDDLLYPQGLGGGALAPYQVQVSVNGGNLSINPVGPYTAGYYVQWIGTGPIAVDFKGSGQDPLSPFDDGTGNQSPIPTYNGGASTIYELIRNNASGITYPYNITMNGITQLFQFQVA